MVAKVAWVRFEGGCLLQEQASSLDLNMVETVCCCAVDNSQKTHYPIEPPLSYCCDHHHRIQPPPARRFPGRLCSSLWASGPLHRPVHIRFQLHGSTYSCASLPYNADPYHITRTQIQSDEILRVSAAKLNRVELKILVAGSSSAYIHIYTVTCIRGQDEASHLHA
jgi:hypothetical protein